MECAWIGAQGSWSEATEGLESKVMLRCKSSMQIEVEAWRGRKGPDPDAQDLIYEQVVTRALDEVSHRQSRTCGRAKTMLLNRKFDPMWMQSKLSAGKLCAKFLVCTEYFSNDVKKYRYCKGPDGVIDVEEWKSLGEGERSGRTWKEYAEPS